MRVERAVKLTQNSIDPSTVDPGLTPQLGPLSWLARRGKLDYFLPRIDPAWRILDMGCADNWFKRAAAARGLPHVIGLDLRPPADIVGNVLAWKELGLEAHSFDVIVAFEVFEHGDFAGPVWDLLKPDGLLMVTTPIPRMDPLCKVLERLHMLQRRTSPHSHLCDLRHLPSFDIVERRTKAAVSQWGVLRPRSTRGA